VTVSCIFTLRIAIKLKPPNVRVDAAARIKAPSAAPG
jgi:hypothetical protein